MKDFVFEYDILPVHIVFSFAALIAFYKKGNIRDSKEVIEFFEKAGKYDELQENGKTELQKANEKAARLEKELGDLKKTNSVRAIREKISGEMKVPAELLTGEDEETCKKQAEAFLKYIKPSGYPDTKPNNRRNTGGHEPNESMRDFARQIFGRGE